MDSRDLKETVGSLKISQEVVATIACNAAKEIEGVASMAVSPKTIKNFVTRRTMASKSVDLVLNDDVATIGVYVNLKYGTNIPDVAEKVQKNVKEAVQNMTSIIVSRVDVFVEGIEFFDQPRA